jgi:hypothetical protein
MTLLASSVLVGILNQAFWAAVNFAFSRTNRSAEIILEDEEATVAILSPGDPIPVPVGVFQSGCTGSPVARPVRALGWAHLAGLADVAVGWREGRLGLAVSQQEAEWIAALLVTYWLKGQEGGHGQVGSGWMGA